MKKLALFLCMVVFLTGCSVNSKVDFVNTANQGTTAVNICTVGVNAGMIDRPKAEGIEIAVRTFENCMIGTGGWYYYLQDPNTAPPPDIVLCASESVIEIMILAEKAGVSVPKTSKVADDNIDLAKDRLELACTRYYEAVDGSFILEPEE